MKKYFIEAFGCFVIGFVIFCILASLQGDSMYVGLGIILSIFILTFAFKNKTSCYFNPAITFGFFLTKKISSKSFWFLLLSEFVGFLSAAAIFLIISLFANDFINTTDGFVNVYGEIFGVGGSFLVVIPVEIMLTALLVFVYLIVDIMNISNIAKALCVALCCGIAFLVTVPLTFGTVNIAKVIATCLFFGFSKYSFAILLPTVILAICNFAGATLGVLLFFGVKKCQKAITDK